MIFLLYPHQLFFNTKPLIGTKVVLIEEPLFFKQYQFHPQKLLAQRASMKYYEEFLKDQNIEVEYFEDESYLELYTTYETTIYDVADDYLLRKIQKHFSHLHILPHPNFLNAPDDSKLLHHFYINRRKELGVLLENGNRPQGGKWSFDAQNRKRLPKSISVPVVVTFENRFTDAAKTYIKRYKSAGSSKECYYPTTHAEAKLLLHRFLQEKFRHFGAYQDAMSEGKLFLFHSNISYALNSGLLDLHETLKSILDYDAPLSAKEGLVRQIIGWREFMLRIYKTQGVQMRNANFFDAQNHMPQKILEAKSAIEPLDDVMRKVLQSGYAHHIERLMILGNIFLLLEIHPDAVYAFFMRYFVDAYDWVMVGNVYGMSQYSDGGSITTKPYIASSNYILKMSDYKKGDWCEIVDALYWSFLHKHASKFSSNPRMQMQLALLEKLDKAKLAKHQRVAREYRTSLGLDGVKEADESRLIEMAWQDRTPFEAIEKLYGLSENQLKNKMRSLLKPSSYKMWRKRVQGRKTKHLRSCEHKPSRFQGPW